jgi:hypothetical protein
MTTNILRQQVPTHFARATRFDLEPRFAPLTAQHVQIRFESLKKRLLQPVLNAEPDAGLRRQLRLASNEAAAVAWTTPFPLLFLPALMEEKTAEVHSYVARQQAVDEATHRLAEASP